jgi:GT2 family glycosyltransferase
MDDDASCEVESLRRTYNLLQYSSVNNLAVAGALLREVEPFRLFEKGALFNGTCIPLKSNMNMLNINDLLYAEQIDRNPDYGGWWFFAFDIKNVIEYAFPFFVRGDDSRFSMVNKFNIITQNGIACWGDDFSLKSGVVPTYLDTRYHILHLMTIKKSSFNKVREIAHHFVVKQLFSYNYSSAKAARMAIQHIMKGPNFFIEHIDMTSIMKELGEFSIHEKMRPIERRNYRIDYGISKELIIKKILRKISLNGFLIPIRFFKKNTLFQHKGFIANLKEIFLYKSVLYEYEPSNNGYSGIGYEAIHDKKIFFREYWIYLKTIYKFKKNYARLQQEYEHAMPKMTSEQFWRDVYSDH